MCEIFYSTDHFLPIKWLFSHNISGWFKFHAKLMKSPFFVIIFTNCKTMTQFDPRIWQESQLEKSDGLWNYFLDTLEILSGCSRSCFRGSFLGSFLGFCRVLFMVLFGILFGVLFGALLCEFLWNSSFEILLLEFLRGSFGVLLEWLKLN